MNAPIKNPGPNGQPPHPQPPGPPTQAEATADAHASQTETRRPSEKLRPAHRERGRKLPRRDPSRGRESPRAPRTAPPPGAFATARHGRILPPLPSRTRFDARPPGGRPPRRVCAADEPFRDQSDDLSSYRLTISGNPDCGGDAHLHHMRTGDTVRVPLSQYLYCLLECIAQATVGLSESYRLKAPNGRFAPEDLRQDWMERLGLKNDPTLMGGETLTKSVSKLRHTIRAAVFGKDVDSAMSVRWGRRFIDRKQDGYVLGIPSAQIEIRDAHRIRQERQGPSDPAAG